MHGEAICAQLGRRRARRWNRRCELRRRGRQRRQNGGCVSRRRWVVGRGYDSNKSSQLVRPPDSHAIRLPNTSERRPDSRRRAPARAEVILRLKRIERLGGGQGDGPNCYINHLGSKRRGGPSDHPAGARSVEQRNGSAGVAHGACLESGLDSRSEVGAVGVGCELLRQLAVTSDQVSLARIPPAAGKIQLGTVAYGGAPVPGKEVPTGVGEDKLDSFTCGGGGRGNSRLSRPRGVARAPLNGCRRDCI